MSTQPLVPYDGGPPPPDPRTRRLGPLGRFTRRRYMLFHLWFTVRLIGRCLADPRVAAGSKALFVGITGVLLFALCVPEAGADLVGAVVPFVGWAFDLVGIPFEGALDWGFFVLVVGWLISLFPPEVLRQHIWELQNGRNLQG